MALEEKRSLKTLHAVPPWCVTRRAARGASCPLGNSLGEVLTMGHPVAQMTLTLPDVIEDLFLRDCYQVFDAADAAALDVFVEHYQHCSMGPNAKWPALFRDYEGVRNSLIYQEIRNGPMGGVDSRIKMDHRRGCGPAGQTEPDILRARL